MTDVQFKALMTTLDATKWTDYATLVIITLSFVAAVAAAIYARNAYKFDHRRSQRQMAMEMCLKWSEFQGPETSSVTKLLERLPHDQCDHIARTRPCRISKEHHDFLVNILQSRIPDIENYLDDQKKNSPNIDTFELESRHVVFIRFFAIKYLNFLESILLAWSTGIADKKAIEKQFAYLFDATETRSAMKVFREKVGVQGFPAIADFSKRIDDLKLDPKAVERPPIVN